MFIIFGIVILPWKHLYVINEDSRKSYESNLIPTNLQNLVPTNLEGIFMELKSKRTLIVTFLIQCLI